MAKAKSGFANRGKAFEDRIMKQCNEYRKQGIAFVIKTFPETVVVRKGAHLLKVIYRDKSILDFAGVLKDGTAFFIEAKSTQNKTSLPLSLIKPHQFTLSEEILNFTELCFYLIHFKEFDKTYLVHTSKVEKFRCEETRKSLPIAWIQENGQDVSDMDFIGFIENYCK